MIATTEQITGQYVTVDSPEGRRLLRRIASRTREEWRFHASAATDWRVQFSRTIRGEAGDPDATVTVQTDAEVTLHGRTGQDVKPFEDAAPVTVPKATAVGHWGSVVRTIARLMADGWRLEIDHSAGSTTSSREGLSFLRLEAVPPHDCGSVTVCETVCKDGGTICSGGISIR